MIVVKVSAHTFETGWLTGFFLWAFVVVCALSKFDTWSHLFATNITHLDVHCQIMWV